MATSRIPAAIDALVSLCQGAVTAGGLLDGVDVFDGPPTIDLSNELMLFIGDDPEDVDGAQASVSGTQDWAALGAQKKDETFTILCTAYARSGETGMKRERDRCFSVKAAVEKLLRPGETGSDIQLANSVLWSGVGGDISLSQRQTQTGALARLSFGVVCRARI